MAFAPLRRCLNGHMPLLPQRLGCWHQKLQSLSSNKTAISTLRGKSLHDYTLGVHRTGVNGLSEMFSQLCLTDLIFCPDGPWDSLLESKISLRFVFSIPRVAQRGQCREHMQRQEHANVYMRENREGISNSRRGAISCACRNQSSGSHSRHLEQ